MKQLKTSLLLLFIIISMAACNNQDTGKENIKARQAKGKLFIIGGGHKPDQMLNNLVSISGLDSSGYVVILPMSSSVPDTSGFYMTQDFQKAGVKNVFVFNLQSEDQVTLSKLDSVRNATLIYMTGGNQNTFMEKVGESPLPEAIRQAYRDGATVAGTSAGAALMSKQMITGDEFKHPEYTGNFRTIEANNIELAPGVGVLEEAIVDQHFIKRMRMNRLISAILENPDKTGIGIDESTAILVEGNQATVYGIGQVMVIRHTQKESKVKNGLLGGKDLNLSIYLPGESFKIKEN